MSDYGMVFALLLLCVYYSWATYAEQSPTGPDAGRRLAAAIASMSAPPGRVLVIVRENEADRTFAEAFRGALTDALPACEVRVVAGRPSDARKALQESQATGLDAIVCNPSTANWPLIDSLDERFPTLADTPVYQTKRYRWPNFLKTDNLLNIANQIVVIAILAIGMTMVIITGGIDLSVGSLIALSAVVAALFIRDVGGAEQATATAMTLACLSAIAVCGLVGLFSGAMVTFFSIPSFIVTLGMMLVASGGAYHLAQGQSVYQVPSSFTWLGRGSNLGLPNAVWLMIVLYLVAHFIMSRTVLGRYIYAVGGNAEAARLSGVPVRRVLLLVYTLCGALAGLGGVVMASQLKSGSPTYGLMYELYVIAAVVVGGASLAGGEGKVLGTLIGAFIIAVIQNGMNLTGIESYTQKIVLGGVILVAVLLDMLKKQSWQWTGRLRRRAGSRGHDVSPGAPKSG